LKLVYLLPFLLFGLWLIQMLYFPQLEAKKIVEAVKPKHEENIFKTFLIKKGVVPREHFHMTDEYVIRSEPMLPLCSTCHGTYPHSKEKKVRAILNFHTGLIACSVCHARKEPGTKDIIFKWVDLKTGEILDKVEGEYGKYPAEIYPIKIDNEGRKTISRPVDDTAARHYLIIKDKLTSDQIAQAKIKLHEHISDKPVFCSDCHKKDGYLDFIKLGFSVQRVNHLNSTEVVGMILKYKTFYLPSEIDFGVEKVFKY
jgi:cytochrome c553